MSEPLTPLEEVTLMTLLAQRHADGAIALYSRHDRLLFKKALRLGLVSADGYLTEAGQRFQAARRWPPAAAGPADENRPPDA
jgi:hypothetical protein